MKKIKAVGVRRFGFQALAQIFLFSLAILALAPIVWAIVSSSKIPQEIISAPTSFDPSQFTLINYVRAFDDIPLALGFRNTLIVLLVKGTITMVGAPMAGFAFAKYDFRLKKLFFSFVLITLMLPTIVLIIPLLLEMKQFGWVNTFPALILPGAVDAFGVFWMRQVMTELPDELLDAGRIDGCSEFGLFARIAVPVARPALVGLGVLTTMNIYNDFVWPVVIANSADRSTIQVILSTLSQNISANNIGADYATVTGELLAAVSLTLIPLLIVFAVAQKYLVSGILAGSMKG